MVLMRAIFDAAFAKRSTDIDPEIEIKHPLGLFVVATGGCEACLGELTALDGAAWGMRAHGLYFTNNPGTADILVVTGTITRTMYPVLERAWTAMPSPKGLVAVGDCAINGGLFGENYATLGGLEGRAVMDLAIHGCPPEPAEILRSIIKLATGTK